MYVICGAHFNLKLSKHIGIFTARKRTLLQGNIFTPTFRNSADSWGVHDSYWGKMGMHGLLKEGWHATRPAQVGCAKFLADYADA